MSSLEPLVTKSLPGECCPLPRFLMLAFSPFSFFFFQRESFTPQTCPWAVSLLGFPAVTFHTLRTTLSHLIPARPLVTFSRTALLAMAGTLFFGVLFTLCCQINFLTSPFVLGGCIPSSALGTVILVVLEHPGSFVAAFVCAVSRCLRT